MEHIEVYGSRMNLNFYYSFSLSEFAGGEADRDHTRTRSGSWYSSREKDELKQRCLMQGEIGFNQSIVLVSAGAAVSAAASTLCGPLITACVLVVGLNTAAGIYVCNDAHTKHKFACARL